MTDDKINGDWKAITYCQHPQWLPAGLIPSGTGWKVGYVMCSECCALASRDEVFAYFKRIALGVERNTTRLLSGHNQDRNRG